MLHATDPPWRTLSAYGGRLLELVEQLESSLPLAAHAANMALDVVYGSRGAPASRMSARSLSVIFIDPTRGEHPSPR